MTDKSQYRYTLDVGNGSIEFRDGGMLICIDRSHRDGSFIIIPYIDVTNVFMSAGPWSSCEPDPDTCPDLRVGIEIGLGEGCGYWLEFNESKEQCRSMAHLIAREIADRL